MYGYESWTIKKAEHRRIDAFELWCWRRLLRVSWTAGRSNQSILKEISLEYSLEGLMLKLQYFGHLMQRTDSFEKTLMLGKIEGRRRRGRQRMRWLDGITEQWTWVWVGSGSWWWTGRPGVLQSMGSQRARHNWTTELTDWTGLYSPWNSLGQNTGVGSLLLLQGNLTNPGLPHCGQILYQLSHRGSPRILGQVAYPFSMRSSWPRNRTMVSSISGGFFTNRAIRETKNLTLVVSFCLLVNSFAQFPTLCDPIDLQHARTPCPSPTPRVYSNSCPLSRWYHPTISSSVVPFSSHLQSFPAPGSFPMSQLFESGGRSIGVSASASVLPMNIQYWVPLG